MAEVEIGIYKSARQAYGFDDIAIVPSRRTRDPEDVDISWRSTPTSSTCRSSFGDGRGHVARHRDRARSPR